MAFLYTQHVAHYSTLLSALCLGTFVLSLADDGKLFIFYFQVDRNNNAIGELDQVVMPFINQGHYKLFRTSIGPGLPCVHLCHPETIRNAIGSG